MTSMIAARRLLTATAGLVALFVLAACVPAPAGPPRPSGVRSASPVDFGPLGRLTPKPTASVPPAAPVHCGDPQPARIDGFPFNRDAARRDKALNAGRGTGLDGYVGGIATFENADAAKLAWLLDERYADPFDAQNAAPTIWAFYQFLCHHPTVRAAGYVVSVDRPDYRLSLESIYADALDAQLRADAQTFCADADETTFAGSLERFWD